MNSTLQLAASSMPRTRPSRKVGVTGPLRFRWGDRRARVRHLRGRAEPDVIEQQPLLGRREMPSGRAHGVGVDRDRRDAHGHQLLGELGPVRGGLAAQRRGDVAGPGAGHDLADGVEHGSVGLVEQLAADLGVAIHAQHQLRQIVRADRDPVDAQRGVGRAGGRRPKAPRP